MAKQIPCEISVILQREPKTTEGQLSPKTDYSLLLPKDGYIRAFDKKAGSLLWEFKLPAPAFATPAMYKVEGKQYLAIACGGEKMGTKKGNKIIAFALQKDVDKN